MFCFPLLGKTPSPEACWNLAAISSGGTLLAARSTLLLEDPSDFYNLVSLPATDRRLLNAQYAAARAAHAVGNVTLMADAVRSIRATHAHLFESYLREYERNPSPQNKAKLRVVIGYLASAQQSMMGAGLWPRADRLEMHEQGLRLAIAWLRANEMGYRRIAGENGFDRLALLPSEDSLHAYPLVDTLAQQGLSVVFAPDLGGNFSGHLDRANRQLVVGLEFLYQQRLPEALLHEARHYLMEKNRALGVPSILYGYSMVIRNPDRTRLPGTTVGFDYRSLIWHEELTAYAYSIELAGKDFLALPGAATLAQRQRATLLLRSRADTGRQSAKAVAETMKHARAALDLLEKELGDNSRPAMWSTLAVPNSPGEGRTIWLPGEPQFTNYPAVRTNALDANGNAKVTLGFQNGVAHTDITLYHGDFQSGFRFDDPEMVTLVDVIKRKSVLNTGAVVNFQALQRAIVKLRGRLEEIEKTAMKMEKEAGNVADAAGRYLFSQNEKDLLDVKLALHGFNPVSTRQRLIRP